MALRFRHLCFALLLAAFVAPPHARATTIDPLTWQQLLFGSDFVGVVECEQAGEIVARYKVVESWKGAAPGTSLTLKITPNRWGPQIPSVLVGERALVTAFKSNPTRMMSTTELGGPIPLWWREMKSDLELPLFQGFEPLPAKGDVLGSGDGSVEQFHARAKGFLALPAAEQEARVLEALAHKYLANVETLDGKKGTSPAVEKLFAALKSSKDAATSDKALLAFGKTSEQAAWPAANVLGQGGKVTLATLRALPERNTDQLTIEAIRALEWSVEHRDTSKRPPPATSTLASDRLEAMRRSLSGPDGPERDEAIAALTSKECGTVVGALTSWKPDAKHQTQGYALGSFVAKNCAPERAKNLTALSDGASDGWLKVAAAVYLSYEEAMQGVSRLHALAAGKGGPATWAALELARRGDKSGMPRLIGQFRDKLEAGWDGELLGQLQTRTAVLLSNSAQDSHVEAPPFEPVKGRDGVSVDPAKLEAWWNKVSEKITVSDPWLPQLAQQHVD